MGSPFDEGHGEVKLDSAKLVNRSGLTRETRRPDGRVR